MPLAKANFLKGVATGVSTLAGALRLPFHVSRRQSSLPAAAAYHIREHPNPPNVESAAAKQIMAYSSIKRRNRQIAQHEDNPHGHRLGEVQRRGRDQLHTLHRPHYKGRRRAEFKKYLDARIDTYLTFPPTQALAIVVDVFLHGLPTTPSTRRVLREVAGSTSLRSPVLTAQYIMMQSEAMNDTFLSARLPSQDQWDARMVYLAPKGISEEHIVHWAWILAAPTADEMVKRFLLEEGMHRPVFLLHILLDSRNRFRIKDKERLNDILHYISEQYVDHKLERQDNSVLPPENRTLDHVINMNAALFVKLLSKLVARALEIWPALVLPIAQITTTFIKTIPVKRTNSTGWVKDGQANRSLVLNRAIQILERQSVSNPLRLARHNWNAQRVLLALANQVEPHITIEKASYQAIRRVLLRLPKSTDERAVAKRYAKTWPPYRENWDGIDEQRMPEDDLSRSVKAGVLMHEAGYAANDHDEALSTLGGGQIDGRPTIQTRSLSPPLWTKSRANLNHFSGWAVEVRATRNAQEAWANFNNPPSPGLQPNIQVYAAMFEKLFAKAVLSPLVLPGDTTREVFPANDVNLSTFEKIRLQPPSVEDLYQRMRQDLIRPVGPCLVQLILHALSINDASRYLEDSPYWHEAEPLLFTFLSPDTAARVRSLPPSIFNAWISLLCRLEEHDGHPRLRLDRPHQSSHIMRAFVLCKTFLAGRNYQPPWLSLLTALTAKKFSIVRRGGRLKFFLHVFHCAQECLGNDPMLLHKLATFTQKHLYSLTMSPTRSDMPEQFDVPNLITVRKKLVALFADIIRPVAMSGSLEISRGHGDVPLYALSRYLQALGTFGDGDEMVRVMKWILQSWEDDSVLEEAKITHRPEYRVMADLFSYFKEVGKYIVPPDEMRLIQEEAQRLVEDKGCTWVWLAEGASDGEQEEPTDVEVARRWMSFEKAYKSQAGEIEDTP